MKSIIPRDEEFFARFEKMGSLIVSGVQEFKDLCDHGDHVEARTRKIKSFEREADEVVHATIEHLHKTFVTPIDRTDIHKLMECLDDILDMTDGASSRINIYQPVMFIQEAKDLADVLLKGVLVIKEMTILVRDLNKNSRRLLDLAVEVNRYENDGDQIRRAAIGRLFREEKNVIELIKWKDILEYIEKATDRCEDVGDIIEGLVLENT
jgi:predicted phosphate transport protein (TIGR00153 family)